MSKSEIKKLNLRHIKGDGAYYDPDGVFGRLICFFAKRFSHVSTLLSKTQEFDASVEQKGVTVNATDWLRLPTITQLPFDKNAYDLTVLEYGGVEYGELQVISKAFVKLFKSKWFLVRDHTDCAETRGFMISKHYLYKRALRDKLIPKKLIKKMNDPSCLTPWNVFCVEVILCRSYTIKPIIKVVEVLGDSIFYKVL